MTLNAKTGESSHGGRATTLQHEQINNATQIIRKGSCLSRSFNTAAVEWGMLQYNCAGHLSLSVLEAA